MRIAVVGGRGRFGSLVCNLIDAAQDLTLHARLGSADSLELAIGCDVVFDATDREASAGVVAWAQHHQIACVVATSGWTAEAISALPASEKCVLFVPNFSIGSAVAARLAAMAVSFFDQVEIVETHHAGKKDAPSGTARYTAGLIAAARAAAPAEPEPDSVAVIAGVPVHSVRMDGVPTTQRVLLGRGGESVTIEHVVESSDAYAAGVLAALRGVGHLSGVRVGLDQVIDLGALATDKRAPRRTPIGLEQ